MVFWGQIRIDKTKSEEIKTWFNFIFGEIFMLIGANNDLLIDLTLWPWMTFKGQIKVIEFLMGSIFWMVHVMTRVYHVYMKHI